MQSACLKLCIFIQHNKPIRSKEMTLEITLAELGTGRPVSMYAGYNFKLKSKNNNVMPQCIFHTDVQQ
jgi:hypothetical protein